MKKIIYYILIMVIVTIILPLLIVRGCNTVMEDVKPKEKAVKPETKITVYIKSLDEVKK